MHLNKPQNQERNLVWYFFDNIFIAMMIYSNLLDAPASIAHVRGETLIQPYLDENELQNKAHNWFIVLYK